MSHDPTRRFSSRVETYARYRPSYPASLLPFLKTECDLNQYTQVADIGSGTGLLTRLFLDYGCEVTGVEPNAEMRAEGERLLAGYERFRSVDGRAETTTLPDHSFDLVTAGQAFHWFSPDEARTEFFRITRPPHWVALVWNKRIVEGDAFVEGYEALLQQYGTDYAEVGHRNIDGKTQSFLSHAVSATFANSQEFDFEGLQGRLDSSSYAPPAGSKAHTELITKLHELFNRSSQNGQVVFPYETNVYLGIVEAA